MSKSGKTTGVSTRVSSPKIGRDSQTGRFLAAAKRMKAANTASPEIARLRLKELGILGADGKLSKNYK